MAKKENVSNDLEGFEEIADAPLLKWDEPGATLTGTFLGGRTVNTEMGEGHVYEIEQTDGEVVAFFAPSILERRLSRLDRGDLVKIIYDGEGEAKKGQNAIKEFRVGFKKSRRAA